jgi:diguanylate cyclase (GGDEF)-like protein/PAS domain S-box-containing protein
LVQALRASEQAGLQLAAIIEGSGDAIVGTDRHGTVTHWNRAAEELFGYAADEIIGRSVSLIVPVGQIVEQRNVRARLRAGSSAERYETVRRHKDGSLVEVLITASTATDAAGDVVGFSAIALDISEGLRVRRALEASRRGLAEAQAIAHVGSFEFDALAGVLTCSDEYYRIFGLDPALPASTEMFVPLVHPEDRSALGRTWFNATLRGIPYDVAFRIIRPDSGLRWVRARAALEVAGDGTIMKLVGTMADETERIEADGVRRAAEARFETGFEQAAIGAAILDLEGTPTRVNPAVCSLLGRSADQLVGRTWDAYCHPDDLDVVRGGAGTTVAPGERRYQRPDGTLVWASVQFALVRDDSGRPQYYLAQLEDITARKQMAEQLVHQALYDELTGLPNRTLLRERIGDGLAASRVRPTQLGVMFLDIDQFKDVNDSVGHSLGDALLRDVADRIVRVIRPGDTVARFGGDEFVVVCRDVTAVEADAIAGRVLQSLSRPFPIGGHEIYLTASLGLVLAEADATPESLLRDSDTAVYRAKERGRGRIELFDAEMRSKVDHRLATAAAMRRALERGEFSIAYQPVVDLSTGTMVSTEALLRWDHPEFGVIGPEGFVPVAEETGLIIPIGAWVLDQACAQLAEWQRYDPSMSIAVNVSVRQMLDPKIVGQVEEVLRRHGVRPETLCLEMTESLLMADVAYFETLLASFKQLGVLLSIDDFGTGYSSLSYLKRFPVDAVKIDRTFVDGLGTDAHDTALVTAIVAMASALDLEVVAEGVETSGQLTNLGRLHCTHAQGFYLSRPMPPEGITRLLATSHRWSID